MRLSKMSRTAYSSSDTAAFFFPLLPAAFGLLERLRLVERLRLAGRERWRLVERRFAAGERDAAREDFFFDDAEAAGEAARRRGLWVRAGDARERPDMAENECGV
jgi:hypothetical protein